ncbi:hypothetical protein PFISCL1PPCAC_12069, partial [Pristionchus fissidentatus]
EDLFGMQACTRMGAGWAHDLWIFHSHWATDDFMMHSLKEEKMTPYPSDKSEQKKCKDSFLNMEANGACNLVFPVLKKLDLNKCKAGMKGWLMEGRLQ